jgi:hypothetical protein
MSERGESLVLVVQIDCVTDPRLQPEALDKIGTDPILAVAIREAAVAHLATHLTRVIAIMPIENAMLLLSAADAVETALGNPPARPHPGYVAPADRKN